MSTMTATAQDLPAVTQETYLEHVNPQWARLLNLLQMNKEYTRCQGTELFTSEGDVKLDFLSGYCVHNAGHNHPGIIRALQDELTRLGPAMLQSNVPDYAGDLAKRLCVLAGGKVRKVFFACSGSEGVESAIKFSRAKTGRDGILYCNGAFHGLTCGALSLMDSSFWRAKFGTMLADTKGLPFGDIPALENALATKKYAAFVVEPLQSEAGIRTAGRDYLLRAQEFCRKTGTLLVADEVQTGMFRTGKFLASHHFDLEPDMVILAKALSGGLIPCSALLMSDAIYEAVFDSLKRSIVHTSTFSENAMSMRAGLATLDVLEGEQLGARALEAGDRFRHDLRNALGAYEMVADVRGLGLLTGIEFRSPSTLKLKIPFETFKAIHPAMFGQIIVMRMFRDHHILGQICGNNFMVLKAAPPLNATDAQLDHYVSSLRDVVDLMHTSPSFWSEALSLARRAANL